MDTEILRIVGFHAIERIAHGKRQGDMRQREDALRELEGKLGCLLAGRTGLGHLLDHLVAIGGGVGDDHRAELARRRRQNALQHGLGAAAQQQAQLRRAVDVE